MPSIRELRDAKRRESFTGRKVELNTFRQLLLADEAEYAILSICGVGGVGKSSLLGQFRRIAQELGYPVAQVDLQVNFGIIEILRTLRAQFEGRFFSEFDKALGTYNQVHGRLQSTAGSISHGMVSGLREGIPFGLGALAVDTVGEERIKNWLYQHLPQSNADLYLHADRVLTTHLVAGLNQLVSRTSKAVLLFDTYELGSKSQDAWLREIFLESDLSSDVLVVIAGRDQLGGMWREWSTVLLAHELAPFNKVEAREYLRNRGITAPAMVEALLSVTGRFPWSLALITDTSAARDLQAEELEQSAAVHNLAGILVDRFLSQVYDDPEMRELVDLCAVPRNFDYDVIRALWGRPEVDNPLDRLRRFSFMRVRDDGRWSVHDIVRQAINQRLRDRTPQRWEQLNQAAAAFYRQRADGWAPYSDEWRWLTLENLYHELQVHEAEGVRLFAQLFEAAKRFTHYDFCSELLSTLEEVTLVQTSSRQWVRYYTGKMVRLADSSAWDDAHAVNQTLYARNDLQPALRARVALDLGRFYYHISCQYLESVEALEESLTLRTQEDGELGEAYVLSHLAPAYAAAGMLKEGREAGRRCVEVSQALGDPYREAWGNYSLGEAEAHAGNWSAALTHLDRASQLFQALDAQFELGVVLRRSGRAQLKLKRWREALANYQANLGLMRQYDKHAWALRALVDISELYVSSGETAELEAVAAEAHTLLERYPYSDQGARLSLIQAEAAHQSGDTEAASVCYVDALLALARSEGCVSQELMARLGARLGQMTAEGDDAEARAMIRDRVRGDIDAALDRRLVRRNILVELSEAALIRLGALRGELDAL